ASPPSGSAAAAASAGSENDDENPEGRGSSMGGKLATPLSSPGRSTVRMVGPSLNTKVRSITFSSSRMFPGQLDRQQRSTASGSMLEICFFNRPLNLSMK